MIFIKRLFFIGFVILIVFSANARKREFLNLWLTNNASFDSVIEDVLVQYSKETGVKINRKQINPLEMRPTLIKAVMEGGGPDIVLGVNDWIGELVDRGVIKDVSKYYREDKFKNKFLEVSYAGVTYKNKLYGIPATMESLILVYNKELVPNPPKTDLELVEMARKISNPAESVYGLAFRIHGAYNTLPIVHGFGGYIYNEKMESGLNSQGTINALKFMYDLKNKYKVVPEDVNDETMHSLFYAKKAGMIITGPWALKDLVEKSAEYNVDLGLAVLPKITSTDTFMKPVVGIKTYMVVKNSKKVKESMELIDYLTSTRISKVIMQKAFQLSATKSAYDNNTSYDLDYVNVFREQFDNGIAMPNSRVMAYFWSLFMQALKNTLKSPEFTREFIDEANGKFQVKIDKYEKNIKNSGD